MQAVLAALIFCALAGTVHAQTALVMGANNKFEMYNATPAIVLDFGQTTAGTWTFSSPVALASGQTLTVPSGALYVDGASTGNTQLASANAGATDYTITLPAATGTLALLGTTQTFSGAKTFSGVAAFTGTPEIGNGLGLYFQNSSNGNDALWAESSGGVLFAKLGTANTFEIQLNNTTDALDYNVSVPNEWTAQEPFYFNNTVTLANLGSGTSTQSYCGTSSDQVIPCSAPVVVAPGGAGGINWNQGIGCGNMLNGGPIQYGVMSSLSNWCTDFLFWSAYATDPSGLFEIVLGGTVANGDNVNLYFKSSNATLNPSFTGSISGTTLTVSSFPSNVGQLGVGTIISGSGITGAGTVITALGTGTGGVGTYTISNSFSLSSRTLTVAGWQFSYTVSGTQTLTQVAAGLVALINANPAWFIPPIGGFCPAGTSSIPPCGISVTSTGAGNSGAEIQADFDTRYQLQIQFVTSPGNETLQIYNNWIAGPVYYTGTTAGTANAQTVTVSGWSAAAGNSINVTIGSGLTNTGSATLNVNGSGAAIVVKPSVTDFQMHVLTGGELVAGSSNNILSYSPACVGYNTSVACWVLGMDAVQTNYGSTISQGTYYPLPSFWDESYVWQVARLSGGTGVAPQNTNDGPPGSQAWLMSIACATNAGGNSAANLYIPGQNCVNYGGVARNLVNATQPQMAFFIQSVGGDAWYFQQGISLADGCSYPFASDCTYPDKGGGTIDIQTYYVAGHQVVTGSSAAGAVFGGYDGSVDDLELWNGADSVVCHVPDGGINFLCNGAVQAGNGTSYGFYLANSSNASDAHIYEGSAGAFNLKAGSAGITNSLATTFSFENTAANTTFATINSNGINISNALSLYFENSSAADDALIQETSGNLMLVKFGTANTFEVQLNNTTDILDYAVTTSGDWTFGAPISMGGHNIYGGVAIGSTLALYSTSSGSASGDYIDLLASEFFFQTTGGTTKMDYGSTNSGAWTIPTHLYLTGLTTGSGSAALCLNSTGSQVESDTSATICGISALRYKNLIAEITPDQGALGILSLRGESYTYKKGTPGHENDPSTHVSLIADDMAAMNRDCAEYSDQGVENYMDRCFEAYQVGYDRKMWELVAKLADRLPANDNLKAEVEMLKKAVGQP
jgi:hypothetical protein